jgi:sulfur carrier protein
MLVVVNGADQELPPGATVEVVLAAISAPRAGVAVAVNGEVVPRSLWPEAIVRAGDRVEVLAAAQGG